MPIQSVILFLISILASALLLGFSFSLKTKHNSRYLNGYFYYIVTVVSYGFVNWIGPSFVRYWGNFDSVNTSDNQSISAMILFMACAVPLALAKLHLFIAFLLKLLNQPQPLLLTRISYSLATLITIILFYLLSRDFNDQTFIHSRSYLTLLGIAVLITTFISLFYFLSKIEQLENKPLQNTARYFGWIYLVGYFVYASPFYLSYIIALPWYPSVSPYIYYAMHLIPLIFLKQFSQQYQQGSPLETADPLNLSVIVNQYNISSREKTILSLILKGKSNSDIAEQLSISPNTVRNHIYNIYGKTNVKNRIQLQRLCDGTSNNNDNDDIEEKNEKAKN